MEFRVLGPLEVVDQGRSLSLGGTKQRALLAVLLLHAGEVVPTHRLIEDLWGEAPPETAAHAVQVYVAALRKLLEPNRAKGSPSTSLRTRAPGYLIEVGDDELDLAPFKIKVKTGGGTAGHNGLRSIASHLKSQDFLRLRVGVGRPGRGDRGPRLRRPGPHGAGVARLRRGQPDTVACGRAAAGRAR